MDSASTINETILLRRIVETLTATVRKQDFLTYFKKLSIVELSGKHLVLGVVSSFMRDNLSYKFYDAVKAAVQEALPETEAIEFVVDNAIDNTETGHAVDCQRIYKELLNRKKTPEETVAEPVSSGRQISEKYRLDNFVVGPSNQLAFAAMETVCRRPGSAYNPLFVYGDVGLGKTHLLQAAGNAIRGRFREQKVLYTTADRFITDYVSCVKTRTVDKLRKKYEAVDTLIMDDVQFLTNKKQTQEELYNIFNLLYESGRQIILSGDRPPKELSELEPRLRSRFEWGIIVDVGMPDFETKLAILQEKARAKEFLLPQDVAEYIAHNTGQNVRELEGILNQLIVEHELKHLTPTVEHMARRLKKLSFPSSPNMAMRTGARALSGYEDLIRAVGTHFGIDADALTGDDRRKQNMIPRQMAMYLLKYRLNYTYERIGNIFSGRNHSAVLYSCRKLEELLKKDQQLVHEMAIIRDKLGI